MGFRLFSQSFQRQVWHNLNQIKIVSKNKLKLINKLLIKIILEEEIDRMAFLNLTESIVARLIPKMGPQSKFLKLLRTLREEIQSDKVG